MRLFPSLSCGKVTLPMKKMIMVSGSASSGKTSFLRHMLPVLKGRGCSSAICKIDCIESEDGALFRSLGYPAVTGISGDTCPDHFLVSNMSEIWQWADGLGADYLFIETAGLCHRCSPATEKTLSICTIDASAGITSPSRLGPMLKEADAVVITRSDMISQAEREITGYSLKALNSKAELFFVDGREGYGIEAAAEYLLSKPDTPSYENDRLRHTMPSGVCSYCVGERRVGSAFQLGVVSKIDFEGGTL